ncbi:hypothetical protein [Thermocrinis sp.]
MSVKELILHIGFHKTGTTSIQEFCYKNREKLLNEFGIYYPNTYGFPGHYIYSFALNEYFASWIPKELRKSADDLLLDLKRELEDTNSERVLMSAEDFILVPNKLTKIINCVEPSKVKIICYIRRQDGMAESIYNESIKNIESFLFPIKPVYASYIYLNYYAYMKNLGASLKEEKNKEIEIDVRVYQKDFNKNWDVIEDFCNAIGIQKSAFPEEKVEVNISLSPSSTEALKRIKERYILPLETFRKVVGFLYAYDKQHPSRIKTLMPLEDRKKILEFFRESNEKLFKEYFNQENLFILSKEEEEFYKEQERISKEEIEREIEERYRSILQFIQNESFTIRTKVFTDQVFGQSELTQEFIKGGIIKDWVGGYVDVCNEERVEGWLLDLKDKETYFLVKLNGIVVYVGRTNLESVDIKDIYGIDWNAGFNVLWKNIKLPKDILALPDDSELEVEIIHERTGYVIPGNYGKLNKRKLIENIKTINYEVKKTINTGLEKLVYVLLETPKEVEKVISKTEGVIAVYNPNGKGYNLICVLERQSINKLHLETRYKDGSQERIEIELKEN